MRKSTEQRRQSPAYRWIVLATAFFGVFGALGFVTILVGFGQTIGPYLGGAMGDAFGSLSPTYYFSAALFIAGAIAALALEKTDHRPGAGAAEKLPSLPVNRGPMR